MIGWILLFAFYIALLLFAIAFFFELLPFVFGFTHLLFSRLIAIYNNSQLWVKILVLTMIASIPFPYGQIFFFSLLGYTIYKWNKNRSSSLI